ncbi:MAG: nucleotidyl transferase AbiEii/AbiGii toxin family protein [Candidatus Thermoplasmatota archaeon]
MIDLDILKLQAVKTGLGIKYLSKEERISLLLKQLNNIFSNQQIILKGGTAFNRGYLYEKNKGRFSEDIDLDYTTKTKIRQKIQNLKKNMKKIKDFKVSKPRILHRTIRFDCQYINQIQEKDRVQVEFYLNQKKSAKSPHKILLQSQYLPIEATNFNVYSLEDLIAQKLVSLYRRTEGKDIYDLFYGLELNFDKKNVYKALDKLSKHYHINLKQNIFLKKLLKKTEEMEQNSYYIGNSTNHFIPKNLRPEWTEFIRGLQEKIKQKI